MPTNPRPRRDSYDVIVVGAGSAGAALAARLSEDEERHVLLLEAGSDYRSADTPAELRSVEPAAVVPTTALASTHTYPLLMATRSPAQAAHVYVRGRGMGGSSSVNGLFAIRATVEDFDGWSAEGCTGWGFKDVLPLLIAIEDDQDFGDRTYHGDRGPTPISRPRRENFSHVESAIEQAAVGLGHPWAPDHNAPGSTGVSPYAFNGRGGVRVSTNDAYIEPARERANLHVWGDVLVDRVLLDRTRAVGVRTLVDGEPQDLHADDVVLCAGAIHTPAILQRSGVGPAVDLRAMGIKTVVDLPVGHNLQEHPSIALGLALHEAPTYGDGPSRGQICVRFSTGVDDEPNDGMLAAVGALGVGVPATGLVGWVNRATSTGRVQLTSIDPFLDPRVDFNLLSDPDDLRRFRGVVDELRAVASQPAFQKIVASTGLGPNMLPIDTAMTEREFSDFSLAVVSDTVHASGTCRMGSPDDPGAVVDPEGRVRGLQNLRVADASILPWVPRANTNLTAIVVGEKIAASIREGTAS